MSRYLHSARAGRYLLRITVAVMLLWPRATFAHAADSLGNRPTGHQYDNTFLGADNVVHLQDDAPVAPLAYGEYQHFGLMTSARELLSFSTDTLRISYRSNVPAGSQVRVDARISADGSSWSEWQTDLSAGAVATFSRHGQYAQYRTTLLANDASPEVGQISIDAQQPTGRASAAKDGTAPTFKVRATRQGMVGRRTANGHVITKRDRFVSLPCYCSLSTRGGDEYKVRLTYRGRSTVVPVYDVGPWNRRDNYWALQKERVFSDLRQGWPQDHAAYFDGHNGGKSGLGWKVSFPTAVDVGDGAWWDDLGINGDQAELEITFLWLGSDTVAPPATPEASPEPNPADRPEATPEPTKAPEATPEPTKAPEATPEPTKAPEVTPESTEAPEVTPEPTKAPEATPEPTEAPEATPEPTKAPEATPEPTKAPEAQPAKAAQAELATTQVDNGDPGFQEHAKIKWYHGASGCGRGGDTLWTYSADSDENAENYARWTPKLAGAGTYEVFVYIPGCEGSKPNTSAARYSVTSNAGKQDVVVDQAKNAGSWVSLGSFTFGTGQAGFVELHDVTGHGLDVMWFDAVKWVPVT